MTEILNLIATAETRAHNYSPAGEPWKKATRIINGHKVQANVFGWGGERVVVWVDGSSEPLTADQAAERVA